MSATEIASVTETAAATKKRYRRGASLIEYARGAGGRIDTLPGPYLDKIAEAIVHGHPKYVSPCVNELLVSGRFRRSRHPLLRDLTLAQLRARASAQYRQDYRRRIELHGEGFRTNERARKRVDYRRRRPVPAVVL